MIDEEERTLDLHPKASIDLPDTKRNKDLHSKFPELSPDERLLQDYICCLKNGSNLIGGRLYLTHLHILFTSAQGKLKIRVQISDITNVEKKSAMMIPNGILIETAQSQYLFQNFVFRDGAFEKILYSMNRKQVVERPVPVLERTLPAMQVSSMILLCVVVLTFVLCVSIVLQELKSLTQRLERLSVILERMNQVLDPTLLFQ